MRWTTATMRMRGTWTMTTEQQPEAPAVPGDCDAAEWGGAPTMLDGQCRCLVCGRCGHHTGNAHQGHYWNLCKVAHGMREPHFCCPDPAFGCELEPAPVPLVMPADEFAAVEAVAAALDSAEVARLREGARMLGKVVVGHSRAMEAARIEFAQGSAGKAMEWILNSLPDVWDDPETEWDGVESAQAWFDRTEAFYRAAEADADARTEADPSADTSRAFATALVEAQARAEAAEAERDRLNDASLAALARAGAKIAEQRQRAERAEARLARIASLVRERLNAPGRSGMSRTAAGIILGIAEGGGDGEAGNGAA